MTPERVEELFGKIVFETDFCVVRAIQKADQVNIYTHYKVEGVERLPLAYMIGSNSLIYSKR